MIVTPNLVFVHVPRTGGTFVRKTLEGHLAVDPNAPSLATHAPYRDLDRRFRDRPGFYVVRNPWDWYVSWYHYLLARGPVLANTPVPTSKKEVPPSKKLLEKRARLRAKQATWTEVFGSGRASFREVVTGACSGTISLVEAEDLHESGLDLYSYFVWDLTERDAEPGNLEVVRYESLRSSLQGFLERRGFREKCLHDAIAHDPPLNASDHRSYRSYYDAELRDLVQHRAGALIERHGYTF